MKTTLLTLLGVGFACLVQTNVVLAASPEAVEVLKTVQPANMVRGGVQQYYKVFEQFPAHWRDVVHVGICQVPLKGPDGQAIDPDDGSLDFAGDVNYLGLESGTPRVAFLPAEGSDIQNVGVNTPTPYPLIFTKADQAELQFGDPKLAVMSSFFSKPDWLRLFAICGLLEDSLRQYTVANRGQPATLDEFLTSGFSPIDRNSVNPVTGERFNFDGAPRDLFVGLSSDPSSEEGLSVPFVVPVMDNGQRVPALNIY